MKGKHRYRRIQDTAQRLVTRINPDDLSAEDRLIWDLAEHIKENPYVPPSGDNSIRTEE